ncbi:MAG: hypothetical protein SF053_09750 [Bacteroidia bacterium]|nr:hypothetical protein [Bacteroidia bacterium]
MQITGTITWVNLSGGFWGINGDDGQQYAPTSDLPAALRREGQQVRATVRPAQVFSIMMWGQHVEVQQIEAI